MSRKNIVEKLVDALTNDEKRSRRKTEVKFGSFGEPYFGQKDFSQYDELNAKDTNAGFSQDYWDAVNGGCQ